MPPITSNSKSPTAEDRRARRIGGFKMPTVGSLTVYVLTVAGFSVVALAHPVLDVLTDHPTFFAAHKVDALALALFAAVATLTTALIGAALAILLRSMGARIGKTLAAGMLGCLLAMICYRVGRQLPRELSVLSDSYIVVASLVGGLFGAALHSRNGTARFATSIVGCACLALVPAYFLTRTLPIVAARNDGAAFAGQALKIARPAPIVFVIFDALRLVELLGDDGRIDEASFPNFAKLSRRATWYRNTTTVTGFTVRAVPALLTGNFPGAKKSGPRDSAPTLAYYPANLFTMLAGVYDVIAEQPVTDLCPPDTCEQEHDRFQIVSALMSDSLALLPYVLGTPSYVATLPSIAPRWKGFDPAVWAPASHRPRQLELAHPWIEAIDRGSVPRLYFLHTLTPHKPFRYTADGLTYKEPDPRLRSTTQVGGSKWSTDIATVTFEHDRYRLQTAAVDREIGHLIERLEHLGIYDDTLIVVTADHGAAFTPGGGHRRYDESRHEALFFVPLFIKAPGQLEGNTDNRPAQSIDVLPTVLELIGADHVEVDGRSLLDQQRQGGERFFISVNKRGPVAIPESGPVSFPPLAVREGRERRSVNGATRMTAAKDATVIVLPPTIDALAAAAAPGTESAYFVHGLVMLDDPSAGTPEVEVVLGAKPAVLAGTFFSHETGRLVFEAIAQSTERPEAVHQAINVALRWPSADGQQERTFPKIERVTQGAESFLTIENAFWYAFWQGHPASISCSEKYRRAFLSEWRQPAVKTGHVRSLAQLIRRASATCNADDETVALHASNTTDTCRCDIIESELTTLRPDSAASASSPPDGSTIWAEHWNGFAFATACTDLVKERFSKNYPPNAAAANTLPADAVAATRVRPPFVLLRAAIENCRDAISPNSEIDAQRCECFSFEWADKNDTEWAKRWIYSDIENGPATTIDIPNSEASATIGEDPGL